ncbi:MAG: stage III sporulation protein AF [Lachnospiraceae bacterium]|nr:stage III sporulation protein AF [Lachnospiraceae bacterium]
MEEIREMVRVVTVFYLLEQMVLNLLPGGGYEKYVRFYLGLLLVLLLLQPISGVAGFAEQLNAEAVVLQLEQEVEEIR